MNRWTIKKKAEGFKPFYTIITVNDEPIDKFGNYLIDNDEEDREYLICKFNTRQEAQNFINKNDINKNDENVDNMVIKYISNQNDYNKFLNLMN